MKVNGSRFGLGKNASHLDIVVFVFVNNPDHLEDVREHARRQNGKNVLEDASREELLAAFTGAELPEGFELMLTEAPELDEFQETEAKPAPTTEQVLERLLDKAVRCGERKRSMLLARAAKLLEKN